MRLTRQTSHAIRILIHCAQAGEELTKVAAIAEQLDITQQNVFKIVHLLARAGFLQAVRGRYGGVRLARKPREIRIGDVVRATEVTHIALDDGETPRRGRAKRSQPISRVFDDAFEAFISVLDQHTLEDMVRTGPTQKRRMEPQAKKARRSGRGSATRRALAREAAAAGR